MASLTQIVVGKDLPNPLIAKNLLKILKDLILFDSSRILYEFPFIDVRSIKQKVMLKFSPLIFPSF